MLFLSKVTIRYIALYLPCCIEYKLKLTRQKHLDSILFEGKTINIDSNSGFEAKHAQLKYQERTKMLSYFTGFEDAARFSRLCQVMQIFVCHPF